MTRQERAAESLRPADTDPKTWAVYLDMIRRMTPGERMAAALEMTELVLTLSESVKKNELSQRPVPARSAS